MLLKQVQWQGFCSLRTIYCTPPLSLPLESFFLNLIKSPWIQFKAILACPTHGIQLICSVQKLAEDCYCFRVFSSVFMIRLLLSHRLDFLIVIIITAFLWSLVKWPTSLKHCAPSWVQFAIWVFRKLNKVEEIPVLYMTPIFMSQFAFIIITWQYWFMSLICVFHHRYIYIYIKCEVSLNYVLVRTECQC